MIYSRVGWEAGVSSAKLAALRWAAGTRALDLGCGRGWYASELANRGFHVIGLDQVNRVDDPRIQVHEGLITLPLSFNDASFDTVLMFDILEHLELADEVMREVARVCTPRGRVILSVPNADDVFLPHYGLTYLHHIDRTHRREYTLAELPPYLEAFNFRTLYCALQGRTHLPLVFAEFVRGPRALKTLARYAITALQKIGLVHNLTVAGDIHWVGERI